MDQLSETITSGATNDAFDPYREDIPYSVICGRMKKDRMAWVGSMMSSTEKWLMEEKSFEITGVGILLSVVFLSLMIGFSAGIRFDRSRNDKFFLNKKPYQMTGIAEVPGEKGIYIPVYKESIE